ncbi:hypothetical protein [Paraburkholderia sp. J11-2]|uniref:hypothetical protein n=1 Tax=Paraburkholderia sp. J11-2 TaxID=2805431 RepID=UPI002AB7B6F2|nr:hypothetical protein [Paraburkholderia sp. J11-2]
MRERPILFSGVMVRAILDGRKTQTRRIVKQSHISSTEIRRDGEGELWMRDTYHCPHGQPGDRLWVRETWQHSNHPFGPYEPACDVFYRADYLDDPLGPDLEKSPDGIRRQWRPSIHMPRAASRITLEVSAVRGERLHHVNEIDARAEGCPPSWLDAGDNKTVHCGEPTYRNGFARLWRDIHGGSSWQANPWVWVISFRRIDK